MFQKIEEGFSRHHIERPEFMGVHYMSASEVEECWQLLRQTFKSISYECLASLPTYSCWLEGQDWTNAYQRHKKNLQLIGLPDRDRRWVLKNPSTCSRSTSCSPSIRTPDHPDPPAAAHDRPVGVQPGGTGDGRVVGEVPGQRHR